MPQYQGVWTLPVAARLQSTQQWATDPLYRNTTLLLQADNAPNGAQNNTFIDSSSNNFTITRNGNTTQGTFTPFSQSPGWWSNYFDGTGDWLSIADSAQFNLGTSNYTMEFWVYPTSFSAQVAPFSYQWSSAGGTRLILFIQNTDGTYQVYINGSGSSFISSSSVVLNQWNHLALVRNSNTFTLYINGTSVATSTSAVTYSDSTFPVYIGAAYSGSTGVLPYVGYISNVRVVIGTAIYTSNFSPSSIPLTAIANTSLLTCQSNRFVDNSTNAFAITVNGNTSVQAFSPFAPQYQYTPSVTGGSGYFDGSGDYLSAGTSTNLALGAGDFTFETWLFATAYNASTSAIIDWRTSGGAPANIPTLFLSASGVPTFYASVGSGALITGSSAVSLNTWVHLAVVRNGSGSSNVTMYLNGVSVGSATNTANLGIETLRINDPQGVYGQAGYFSNLRIVKGTAVYTAAFTPPTAPLTAITNTSLLLNFTNAGIVDGTMKNNLETVGNAQVNTSIVKYGTGSMAFDGTGDYLVTPSSPVNILGSGDFTIEFWAYPNNTSSAYRALVASENYNATTGGWSIYQNGASIEVWLSPGTPSSLINATSALTAATWQHVALSRASGTVRLFVNGVSVGSASNTIEWTGQRIFIGDNNVSGTDYFYNGYIDDLRITKGVARYTANFTPPTVALPRQ